MKSFLKIIRLVFLLLFISLLFVSIFIKTKFELLNFDQILYYLTSSLEGTSNSFFINGFKHVIVYVFIFFTISLIVIKYIKKYDLIIKYKNNKGFNLFNFIYKMRFIIDIVIPIIIVVVALNNINFFDYFELSHEETMFYEKEYVDPRDAKIDFDGKRNLIMIYVESLESTDFSKEAGGYRNQSLIPNLEKLYLENDNLGKNYHIVAGDAWTIAGMFASVSGIPYKAEFANDFAKLYGDNFLPGAYTLGDYLKEKGYNQTFIMGSESEFGSRDLYLNKHGNYDIIDYNLIKDKYEYNEEDKNDWGFNDRYIFDIAKEKLSEFNKSDKPFNLSLLTSNTHPIEGYVDNKMCKYNNSYTSLENAYACEDIIINDFIDWVKEQDFYENTTIVIVGDHLAMYRQNMGKKIPDISERNLYGVIINSKNNAKCNSNHSWMTVDIYPTILTAMGAKINGDRLGLGTNVFSCRKTIFDEYSYSLYEELVKKSLLYDNCIMNNKCDEYRVVK